MEIHWLVYAVLITHFIADFILQSHWMASNKSKSWVPLLAHIGVYTACMVWVGWQFALVNGVMHLVVDFFTSRATAKLWAKKDVHNFFVVIGLDQLIHSVCLLSTLSLSWW
jgi:hypothetical protein